jgi:hypothetical protein
MSILDGDEFVLVFVSGRLLCDGNRFISSRYPGQHCHRDRVSDVAIRYALTSNVLEVIC